MPNERGKLSAEERRAIAKGAAAAASENMRIVELVVENMMKVRFARVRPHGNVVIVSGRNGQGKSSLLKAIHWALTGTSDIPTMPIRKGQRTAVSAVKIGDFTITRHFTAVDAEKSKDGSHYISKLIVTGKHGEKYPNPQALLNGLMGEISFDPLAFIRMDDKKQLETLRGLVTFDIDIDAHDAAYDEMYDKRREAGRELDSLRRRTEVLVEPAADVPAEPIGTEALTKKLSEAANHNSIVAAKKTQSKNLLDRIEARLKSAEDMRRHAAQLLEDASKIDGAVAGISLVSAAKDAPSECNQLQREREAIEIGEEIDTAAVIEELNQANATNRAVAAAAQYRTLKEELEVAETYWNGIDEQIKANRAEREAAIARAKMPIEHLGVSDSEVLYKGLPFSQASNAEQIRVSMALGMASNPKLRVLRILDGSLLDSDSMKLIEEAANQHGFQVWIERVDASGNVGVLMEDGEASGEDVVTEEAEDKAKKEKF